MRPLKKTEISGRSQENFETTEGESVDLYDKLMEMTGWKVADNHDKYPMIGQKMFTGSTSWTP